MAQAHPAGPQLNERPLPARLQRRHSIILLAKLQQINNWDKGGPESKASFGCQAEGQFNLSEQWPALKKAGLEVLAGADHHYIIVPDGNYFINPSAGKEYTNITWQNRRLYLRDKIPH